MGKPAARMGDTTAHGGTIMAGAPTVLIGGMPAARANDMHVCPMMNPGTPPPPHVGQQILLGSPTVLICGQMAARMGDQVMCSGPPDSIMAGCVTVLIGESAGGGGGAGGPGGAAASAAMAGGEAENEGGHFLDVKFTDSGGFPIKGVKYAIKTPDGDTIKGTLGGQIKKTGIKEGSYEIQLMAITKAEWSDKNAKVGDTVKLLVETAGIDSGEKACIDIYIKDANYSDKLLKNIESEVSSDKIELDWKLEVDDELLGISEEKDQNGGYSQPFFYFSVRIDDLMKRSGLLIYKDWIELELKDEEGNPVGNKKYRVFLPNGEIKEGKLDSNGYAKVEDIPPGNVKVTYDLSS